MSIHSTPAMGGKRTSIARCQLESRHQARSQLRENLPWSISHIDQRCKHDGCEMAISLIV